MPDKGGELGKAEEFGEEVMGEELWVFDLKGVAVMGPCDDRLVFLHRRRGTCSTSVSFSMKPFDIPKVNKDLCQKIK